MDLSNFCLSIWKGDLKCSQMFDFTGISGFWKKKAGYNNLLQNSVA